MSQEPFDPRPGHPEADAVAEYPAVSRLAVIALLLGLGAIGAVISPLLVCLAVAGAVLAVAALRSLARRTAAAGTQGRHRGAAAEPALRGLGHDLAMGAPAGDLRRVPATGRQVAAAGSRGTPARSPSAAPSAQRSPAPGASLEDYYKKTRDARFELDSFFEGQPLRQLVTAGQQGQLRFLRYENLQNESYAGQRMDIATLRYAFDYQQDSQPRTLEMRVAIARTLDSQGTEAHWELRSIQTPKDGA